MIKPLEDYLWNEISCMNSSEFSPKRSPMDVINEMIERKWINSPKQGWRTLEKWVSKGKYEYGSRLDLGWKKEKKEIYEI